jgi:hypothetical protein
MQEGRDTERRVVIMRKSPARLLIKRLSIMFLVFSAVAAYLYVIGNLQLFLDETQRLLLSVLRWSSLASTSLAVIGILFFALARRVGPGRKRATGITGYVLAAAASAALATLSFFVDAFIR